ncbi:MAG: GAF domain-containing protein [Arenimonas sp.]|nr:GAF domain-containing protein [Arenimonas sp.]
MFTPSTLSGGKAEQYQQLIAQCQALLHGERHRIANAANLSALLFNSLPGLNWLGFYFLEQGELIVGPFQGLPACVRIALGKGVCGTAALTRETQLVPDVHAFEGHIACDSASQSELVVPLIQNGALIGVLDIDSPLLNRFDAEDQVAFERIAELFCQGSN